MSDKVKLENTSDAAVYLPHRPGKDEAFANDMTIVPRAKREETTEAATGEKHVRKVFGTAEMDVALWDRVKKDKAVVTLLSRGSLRVAGSSGPPPEAATAGGPRK